MFIFTVLNPLNIILIYLQSAYSNIKTSHFFHGMFSVSLVFGCTMGWPMVMYSDHRFGVLIKCCVCVIIEIIWLSLFIICWRLNCFVRYLLILSWSVQNEHLNNNCILKITMPSTHIDMNYIEKCPSFCDQFCQKMSSQYNW